MTDEFGLFQFASYITPDKNFGYTLDDNARALIVCSWLLEKQDTKELRAHITIYFNFIKKCLQENGTFINYIGFDKLPTSQNRRENLEDVQGRTLWTFGEMMNNKTLSSQLIDDAKEIFLMGLEKGLQLTHLRAQAFAIKAFALALNVLPDCRTKLLEYIKKYSDSLINALKQHSLSSWSWFENHLTYNNGLLPESLLIAGDILKNKEYTDAGVLSLTFLIDTTFSEDIYYPIGNSHWYIRNQKRSYYDQQPEDPTSMILTLVRAYKYTHKEKYKNLAIKCFDWFLGANSLNLSLYDDKSCGCHDGLQPNRMNLNQGAESLISYLMGRVTIQDLNE
ncbi:MAG: hypothetical protein V1922_03575 [bacterium]